MKFPTGWKDCKKFKKDNPDVALNILFLVETVEIKTGLPF